MNDLTVFPVDAVLRVLAERLATVGIVFFNPGNGRTFGEETSPPLFFRRLPAEPATAVALTPYAFDTAHDPNSVVRTVFVQARVRAERDAMPLAEKILETLTRDNAQTTARVSCFVESVAALGYDSAGRDEVTVNLRVITGGA